MKIISKLLILIVPMVLFTACSEKNGAVPADKKLNLANSFYTNGLYEDAVGEYLDYLQNYTVDDGRRANTYYTIAEIYFERHWHITTV
jgi:TolA-binding protein